MKTLARLAVGLATGAASIALAPTAAAQPGTCAITFQPFDGRSYAAAAVVDGNVEHIITRQSGVLDNGPVTVTYTAPSGVVGDLTGVTEIWWAARNPARQNVAADFYDVMHVRPDCTFVETYHAIPGKQDSVVIRRDRMPTPTLPIETTTSAAPTTTSSTAPTSTLPQPTTTFGTTLQPTTTTTEQPPNGTTSTVAMPTTTIEVDVPLTEEPTTTAPAPPPTMPVPSTSTTSPVDLYTATSVENMGEAGNAGTLPHTGINSLTRLIWGVGLMAAGLILAIGGRACRRLQRARVQS